MVNKSLLVVGFLLCETHRGRFRPPISTENSAAVFRLKRYLEVVHSQTQDTLDLIASDPQAAGLVLKIPMAKEDHLLSSDLFCTN